MQIRGLLSVEMSKVNPYKYFVEFFNYCPLEGEKFQLVCGVVGFSLGQAPTHIGYYSICAILAGLVENRSNARPTSISVQLESWVKSA